ncbi:Oidioi.mRNA.OKI2018_I69.chr1.g1582.t1.cds [Oikopleura dioica]|uniref:Oidioi.mRNA.OKI2018_I69.chr1.g1582.t1.cds n=1 Tax=Oikopleura dioica TaxID=34765 RepID=A0ABN7SVD3_OIKDI|nr:Oidioi.mRNA.OKI2018_I69.chr1.g1582.t1.cds [Oikopleura dioica]
MKLQTSLQIPLSAHSEAFQFIKKDINETKETFKNLETHSELLMNQLDILQTEVFAKDDYIRYLEVNFIQTIQNFTMMVEEQKNTEQILDAFYEIVDSKETGIGFYTGDDKGSVRSASSDDYIKKVFDYVDLGLKKINLKFFYNTDREIHHKDWTIRYTHSGSTRTLFLKKSGKVMEEHQISKLDVKI